MNRTHACFFLCLLLLGCLSCGDPPTSVMELVMPDNGDTAEPPDVMPVTEEAAEPETTDNVTVPLFEMEAILATRGEVHSPIPDDVYDALWGHWTEVGLSTPRDYYTKYIDADGIAIVGGDLVDDRFFQAARHIALVMTAKLPGLRDALSYNQPGGISGDDIPFRLVLTEHFSADFVNMPDYHTIANPNGYVGTFDGIIARADVWFPPDDWGWDPDHMGGVEVIIHEMAHAIDMAIFHHNLVPQFTEHYSRAWEREMDKVRLREEARAADANIGELVAAGNLPIYCMANSNSHASASEFWAWFVERKWFDQMWNPQLRVATDSFVEDFARTECPNLFAITESVFPAFPLRWAISAKDYK